MLRTYIVDFSPNSLHFNCKSSSSCLLYVLKHKRLKSGLIHQYKPISVSWETDRVHRKFCTSLSSYSFLSCLYSLLSKYFPLSWTEDYQSNFTSIYHFNTYKQLKWSDQKRMGKKNKMHLERLSICWAPLYWLSLSTRWNLVGLIDFCIFHSYLNFSFKNNG